MVNAILYGKKTQTRRAVSARNSTINGYATGKQKAWLWKKLDFGRATVETVSIYGKEPEFLSVPLLGDNGEVLDAMDETRHRVRCRWSKGDRIWVREDLTWRKIDEFEGWVYSADETPLKDGVSKTVAHSGWSCPAIYMPRAASRITLEIVSIRVQRVQDITEADAKAEGVPFSLMASTHKLGFENLWNSITRIISGVGWDANPWVWAIKFRRVDQ